ncbi:MAG: hypothetical protein K2I79_00065, partial [Clostridia bacterium]|nr:hypothetical protein [Clostridia bacterium]
STNINDYKKASDYESAYNSNKTIIKLNFNGYFNVRSILFKFTDEQTKYLSVLSNLVGGKDDITVTLREFLALGVSETAISGSWQDIVDRYGEDGKYNGMTVNISNPDYDSDDSDSVAYTDKDVSYADVLAAMIKYIADKKAEFIAKVKELNGEAWATANAAAIERYAIDEAFTDLIYMVNDDDGMFSNDFYTVSADGQDTNYVEEYAVLARRLYKESDTSTRADIGTMSVADKGKLLTSSVTGSSALESKYLTNVAGTEYKLYLSKKKAATEKDEIEANVYTFETSLGSISFIVNTYGIQMIMIDGYAFDEEEIGKSVDESNGVYTIKENYVYSNEIKVEYEIEDDFTYKKDDDGNKIIASIKVESKTFKEYLTETMLENKKSAIYNYDINIFVKEQESAIVKKDKVFKALKKDIID